MNNIPNILSISRVPLALLFSFFAFLPSYFESDTVKYISIYFLISLFILIELSDLLDGFLARKFNLVSDLGKILDPYSDVFSRLTYFICFSYLKIIPIWALVGVFYREITVIFMRSLLVSKNIYFQARLAGKIKAVCYSLVGLMGIISLSNRWLLFLQDKSDIIKIITFFISALATFAALWSLVSYILFANKAYFKGEEK